MPMSVPENLENAPVRGFDPVTSLNSGNKFSTQAIWLVSVWLQHWFEMGEMFVSLYYDSFKKVYFFFQMNLEFEV